MLATIIGITAATASVIAFVPQVWRIVKTRGTKDLSTAMWILQTCAFAAWIGYGAMLGQWPIIVPNALCCAIAAFILAMQLVPTRTRDRIAAKLDPR